MFARSLQTFQNVHLRAAQIRNHSWLAKHRHGILLPASHRLRKPSDVRPVTEARRNVHNDSSSESQLSNSTTFPQHGKGNYNFLVCGAIAGAAAFLTYLLSPEINCKEAQKLGRTREGLVYYGKKEISKHKSADSGIWVTYQHNVYDITEFVEGHPGGSSKIMLAAGGAVEPYWDMYAIHKKAEVLDMLKEYKIGEIKMEERVEPKVKKDGPFANEPKRHPALIANSQQPFNAETPPELAMDNFVTPNELFFVRNHLPVPVIGEKDFTLEIQGEGKKSIKLSLEDLQTKFKRHKITATLQCAGNRRSQMNEAKTVRGLNWTSTAISNAEWEGVLLRDVLLHYGLDGDNSDAEIKHIHFEGLDIDPTKAPYGASIPAYKALDSSSDVLLAFNMNGKPLPRDHGFPLRVVVPGVVGARNVKWLSKIVASKDESPSHWQQNDYKGFSPNIDWHNVDFKSAPAIQESPVTSAICMPKNGTTVFESDEDIVVQGYAYSGGGRGIIRVDVSIDAGKTWQTAKLKQSDQPLHRMWSWTLWTAEVPIPEGHNGSVEICCKAVDSSYNTQPENVKAIWNLRGVLNNSWYRVNLKVESE